MSGFGSGSEAAAVERSFSPQPGRDKGAARSYPTSTSSFSGFGDDAKGQLSCDALPLIRLLL